MTPDAIRHAVRPGGSWQTIVPGVIATFSGPFGDLHRIRAALLSTGDGAMITGGWACWMLGLRYGPPRGDEIDVLVGRTNHHRGVGFVRVRTTTRLPRAVLWADDASGDDLTRPHDVETAPDSRPGLVPMAPAARAVIDTVTRLDQLPADWQPTCDTAEECSTCRNGDDHAALAVRNVRAVMCEIVQGRKTTVRALADEVAAAPIRGARLARAAISDIIAGCRSAPECEVRDLVRKSRILPDPRWNQVLPGARGIFPDACWPEARLVVEVDSRAFHGFGDAPARTEERRARLATLGWRVLPISPARLRREPRKVLRELEAAYLAGLSCG